jgi:hypothetical protein
MFQDDSFVVGDVVGCLIEKLLGVAAEPERGARLAATLDRAFATPQEIHDAVRSA